MAIKRTEASKRYLLVGITDKSWCLKTVGVVHHTALSTTAHHLPVSKRTVRNPPKLQIELRSLWGPQTFILQGQLQPRQSVTLKCRGNWDTPGCMEKSSTSSHMKMEKGFSLKFKGKAHTSCVSCLTHGSESWPMEVDKVWNEMLRWVCSTLKGRKVNWWELLELKAVSLVIKKSRQRRFGHVEHKDNAEALYEG